MAEKTSHDLSPENSSTVTTTPTQRSRHWLLSGMAAGVAALLSACSSTPPAPSSGPAAVQAQRDYRQQAARHLYERNAQRIYSGKLPPMLYAIGVLQVDVDARGQVSRLHWLRAPTHAPEVVSEIERTVRSAAPFPAPGTGRTTYTDTWLWDRSGRFQLDTLTEGQLGQ